MIERANGVNARFILNNKIGVGAIIKVSRHGDTIPNIDEVIKPAKKVVLPEGKWNSTNTEIVKRRASKLNIDILHQGITDKLKVAKQICNKLNVNLSEVAYIGDDLGDIELLKNVGYSCCPNNSPSYVKKIVDFVTIKNGGEGAFREFIEHLMKDQINNYLNEL